eukprot:gnl/TRDRNA2_/TRDRNA2_182750_c0_seq1.p1 gnl/TRDRNA2_/TRDRNA2_182750_c0~~gnl/TRDRNA2_/TRDRNA2_182750_c0_seq1.p1  ORF type:complete len:150 (-),score=30.85 gnl/TRDRNA2_/TRDRNA2_182750_c0_seq1:382-831(-)
MASSNSVVINGKEIALSTRTQLQSLNTKALRQRAMNLRDDGASYCFPSMPIHSEALIDWMIEVQKIIAGQGGVGYMNSAPSHYRAPQISDMTDQNSTRSSLHRRVAFASKQQDDDTCSTAGSEMMENKRAARLGFEAARRKAQSSNIFG